MKKIIAAALAIMLSLSNMAFAQVYAQKNSEKSVQEKAIDKVTALKIMEGYEENGEIVFKPENQITKLEFVVALVCAMSDKRDLVNVDADTPFVDISASHWACGYINEAISLNIIEADSLFFNPDVKLMLKDAIKILLDSMGYKEYASVKGDGLNGYMELYTRLKMSKGISTGFNDILTRGEAAILLSNAIDINIMDINGVMGDDVSYGVSETRTIISQMRNIYKVRGTVIANEFTSINQSGATNYAAVKIDSELYLQGNTGICKDLGMLVEAYYVDDEKGKEIIYYEYHTSNTVLEITAQDISDATKSQITYYENSRKMSAKIESGTKVIYNGKYYGKVLNIAENMLKPAVGRIKLIDNDHNGVYELIIVHNEKTYVVDEYSASRGILTHNNDFGVNAPIDLQDEEKDFIIEKDGKKVDYSAIKKWDIVNVEISADNSLYTLTVSDKTVSGVLNAVDEDAIYIDDTKYLFNKNTITLTSVILGEKVSAYLDNYGNISAYQYADGEMSGKYGYLVKAAGDKSPFKKTTYFQIFNTDGKFEDFASAEKISIDGYIKKESNEVISALTASGYDKDNVKGNGVYQLIKYTINDNDEISYIDTLEPNKRQTETDLTLYAEKAERQLGGSYKYFHKKGDKSAVRFNMTDDTYIFDIPTDKSDLDNYTMRDTSYFNLDTPVVMEAYDSVDLGIVSVCIINTGGATGGDNFALHDKYFRIVAKKVMERDEDGNYAEKIYAGTLNELRGYSITDETKVYKMISQTKAEPIAVTDIKFGDIICADIDNKGNARRLIKIFPRTKTLEDGTNVDVTVDDLVSGTYYADYNFGTYDEYIYGHIEERDGKGIKVNIGNGDVVYYYLNGYQTITKYNINSRITTEMKAEELIASTTPDIATKVFMRVRNGDVREIFVYEEE